MNILVIGSGGREHAICLKFSQSDDVNEIHAIPGNAGMAKIATCNNEIDVKNHQQIIEFCQKNKIDLVFVGPEQPLVDGLIDDLKENNINCFGPNKFAAQIEGSKDFMKKLAANNNVPTAKYETFTEFKPAYKFAKSLDFPCVIKADGLAAGKGVIIAQDKKEAKEAIKDFLDNDAFGEAGKTIIIEEFLEGAEISYFVICDESGYQFIGCASDHKKVGDGGTGPNTGGMGTFTPTPFLTDDIDEAVKKQIIEPTLTAFKNQGQPYCGILFAGLIMTKDGPKLLEFNARFGDPETQVILPRIKTDFAEIILKASQNKLSEIKIELDKEEKFICVVIASKGYPGKYQKNILIENLELAEEIDNVNVIHAGTIERDGKIFSNGGRVLNIIAHADSFKTSRKLAYEAVRRINWESGFCRTDIAQSALVS